jgi:hypothetical protein
MQEEKDRDPFMYQMANSSGCAVRTIGIGYRGIGKWGTGTESGFGMKRRRALSGEFDRDTTRRLPLINDFTNPRS